MPAATKTDWGSFALEKLQAAGFRRGGARTAVVEALADQDCAISAFELEDLLRERGGGVARASIYRALEQLADLGLLKRLEVCRGTTSYERVEPGGEHHHHAICADCGKLIPFEDNSLERAIDKIAGRMSFDVAEHDVVLRGRCEHCTR
ncbi:MAG: transcriptional repressor [Actinobacteria bacterium]|nr:transcriptional repressor [Actinomycetota bacterium]